VSILRGSQCCHCSIVLSPYFGQIRRWAAI
jgi:hypothetical protein